MAKPPLTARLRATALYVLPVEFAALVGAWIVAFSTGGYGAAVAVSTVNAAAAYVVSLRANQRPSRRLLWTVGSFFLTVLVFAPLAWRISGEPTES